MAVAVLGPYALEALAGRGGMGEVWRARHADGFPAAVKVLTAARAADDRFRLAFRDEVRAVAALDHPHVVRVYDHGEVGADAGVLEAGSPWLATEWASGNTLRSGRLADWRALRDVLAAVLEALAHVHARGLLHGDIKPANVLVCGPADLRPGLKLADFGVSRTAGGERRLTGGTVAYMAPEALTKRVRDLGPWTDLYAVGAMAWELVCGAPPLDPRSPLGRARAHLDAPLPAFLPKRHVPEGFGDWVARLLAWDPGDRPPFAADALFALGELGEPGESPAGSGDGGAAPVAYTTSSSSTFLFDGEAPSPRLEASPPSLTPAPSRPPPVPADWRTPAASRADSGAMGLALWGLRPVPMVGREAERDALWDVVRRCAAEQQPHVVVLRGPAGVGRSRLAAWLCERAQEVGAAVVWRASFSEPGGPEDGIGPMLAREAAVEGLSGDALLARVAYALPGFDEHDRHALAEVFAPSGAVQLRPRDATVLAQRLIEARRRDRTALVCLDDGHLAPAALDLVDRALRVGMAPLLLVVTARDEEVAERPEVARRLAQWPTVEVRPLEGADRLRLVEAALPLERTGFTGHLAEQAGGNPLLTVALVGDLVRRGLVVPGVQGYRLEAEARLPEVGDAWRARAERALAPLDPEARRTVELAAALGTDVDTAEWQACCRCAGDSARLDVVEALIAARLASARRGGAAQGWSFVHSLLRQAIRDLTGASAADLHRACAEALRARGCVTWRVASHLIEAGDADAAATLVAAAERHVRQIAYGTIDSSAHVHVLEKALDAIDAPAADPRRIVLVSWRGSAALQAGRIDEAVAMIRLETELSREAGLRDHACAALVSLSHPLRLRGDLEGALAAAVEGFEEASASGYPGMQLGAAVSAAKACADLGRLAEARRWLALADVADWSETPGLTAAARLDGVLLRLEGRPDEAVPRLEEALALAGDLHNRWDLAETHNALGDVHRAAGNLDEAERHYLAAGTRFRTLGSGDAAVADLNAAMVLIERGAFGDAEPLVSRCAVVFERQGRSGLVAATHAVLLPCIAHRGDAEAFDLHVGRAEDGLRATSFVEDDIARVAIAAGDLWSAKGDPLRAGRAWTLAEDQYRRLGRPAEADALAGRAPA